MTRVCADSSPSLEEKKTLSRRSEPKTSHRLTTPPSLLAGHCVPRESWALSDCPPKAHAAFSAIEVQRESPFTMQHQLVLKPWKQSKCCLPQVNPKPSCWQNEASLQGFVSLPASFFPLLVERLLSAPKNHVFSSKEKMLISELSPSSNPPLICASLLWLNRKESLKMKTQARVRFFPTVSLKSYHVVLMGPFLFTFRECFQTPHV